MACSYMPMLHVIITFQVNSLTAFCIQQGCSTSSNPLACTVEYRAGTSEDSRGKQCRIATWDRFIPAGTFVSLITANVGCGQGCTVDASTPPNKLISYTIDGVNIMDYLTDISLTAPYTDGCVSVACLPTSACCKGNQSLENLPPGYKIEVGPIGVRSFP